MPSTIHRLFIKTARHRPVRAMDALTLTADFGIAGDIHAHRLSPRQVLVTAASQLADLAVAPGALSENIVLADVAIEHFRPGSAIVGGDVEIRLTMYCEPCRQIAPLVGGKLADVIEKRGILGVVVRGGTLRAGAAVTVVPGRYAPLPASIQQRFIDVVTAIPTGRVLRYRDLALAMGVDDSFVRALPGYIKRHLGTGLPLHRIVNARGQLLATIPQQAQQLAAEGVAADGAVDLDRFLWQG